MPSATKPAKAPKKPKLRWDQYKRQVLCCLFRFFVNNNNQFEQIFSYIFRAHLRGRGINDTAPFRTLRTQWIWMRNNGSLDWSRVHRETPFETNGVWREIIEKIKSAARTLNLPLREKTVDVIDITRWKSGEARTQQDASGPPASPITPAPLSRLEHSITNLPEPAPVAVGNQVEVNDVTINQQVNSQDRQNEDLADCPAYDLQNISRQNSFACEEILGHPAQHLEDLIAGHRPDIPRESAFTCDESANHPTNPFAAPLPNSLRENSYSYDEPAHHPAGDLEDPFTDYLPDAPREKLYAFDEPVVTSHGKCCLWCHHEETMGTVAVDEEPPESQRDDIEDPDGSHQGEDQAKPDLGPLPTDELPPLLYRWYNNASQGANSPQGIQSGLFASGTHLDYNELTLQQFCQHFRFHVKPERVLTPFISTFRSPLAPLQRALRSANGAKITVIDTQKLQTQVFYAHTLASYAGGFTFCWRGYGEFLIWGEVPADAIVFTIDIEYLEEIALAHRDINRLLQLSTIGTAVRCDAGLRKYLSRKRKSAYKSGRTFGKLLSILWFPTLHWEHAAQWFMQCWGWKSNTETVGFLRGMKSEIPYAVEELSDSEDENERYLPTPRKTPKCSDLPYEGELPCQSGNVNGNVNTGNPTTPEPRGSPVGGQLMTPFQTPEKSKLKPFVKMRLDSSVSSDIDYKPPDIEENSEYSSSEEASVGSEKAEGWMENKTETTDDEVFSTHESLSSSGSERSRRKEKRAKRGFPEVQVVIPVLVQDQILV